MNIDLVYLILAMAAVTYIPRMLPLVLLQRTMLPPYMRRFMSFIPYAALGALIFPGVLHATGNGRLDAALAGCLAAVLLSWRGANLVLVIAGGIMATFAVSVLR